MILGADNSNITEDAVMELPNLRNIWLTRMSGTAYLKLKSKLKNVMVHTVVEIEPPDEYWDEINNANDV